MNQKEIEIVLEGVSRRVISGTTLESLLTGQKSKRGAMIVAATVNNEVRELTFALSEPAEVRFVDMSCEDGLRIYQRSLKFLLIKALHDCYPDRDISIRHSVSKGIFFDIVGKPLTECNIKHLERHMRELAAKDIPFQKVVVSIEEARRIFEDTGRVDRLRAIQNREKDYVSLYLFEDVEDYFYGYMVPSSGYLKLFELEAADGGLVLVMPKKEAPDVLPEGKVPGKLFQVFSEYTNWINVLGVSDIGKLNEQLALGQMNDFIRISEALHEKTIAGIADQIKKASDHVRMVLIAGPSSSGKTTFAQRLSVQLRVNGIVPVNISVDNYFIDQRLAPMDEDGKPDLESIACVDLPLFNRHLKELVDGRQIEMPTFNFHTGLQEYHGLTQKLDAGHMLVIEGIHGLNPQLTSEIPDENKFCIYISAITSMQIDRHNRIPTTDLRLIRRLVRDHRTRGASAQKTLDMWPSVRKGEERNIFPFQERADAMFNSSLIYELGVLKPFVLTILGSIHTDQTEYAEARRLIEFLSYIEPIPPDEVPNTSILREFIGGSGFSGG